MLGSCTRLYYCLMVVCVPHCVLSLSLKRETNVYVLFPRTDTACISSLPSPAYHKVGGVRMSGEINQQDLSRLKHSNKGSEGSEVTAGFALSYERKGWG